MAKLDTNRIWRSLGTFWDLFPQEERVYLATFWESWADIVADLWGLTFQVDRTKSLFSTSATFERRNVLVQISGLKQQKNFTFTLASVQTTPAGAVIVRGFVPRDRRTFRANEIPAQGLVRIGVDTLKYVSVNVVAIVGGAFDGYVREALFTLEASTVPHDYGDSIDMNDSFYKTEIDVSFRVNQSPGATFVDTTSAGRVLDLNPTGILRFGTPGLNYEQVQYQTLSVVGDRYVFGLPSTWGPGQSGPVTLQQSHPAGELVKVSVLSPSRWAIERTGPVRVYGDNAAVFVIDDQPSIPAVSLATMRSAIEIQENSDFDMAVTLFLDAWPSVAAAERRAGIKMQIGPETYILYVVAHAAGNSYAFGVEGLPVFSTISSLPSRIELNMSRTGSRLEINVREGDASDFRLLTSLTVTGERARLSMFAQDTGTETAGRVRFDEVVRRQGQAAGSVRLEDTFLVDDLFPYRYATDVQLVSASSLRDAPRIKEQSLITIDTADGDTQYLKAIGSGDDFDGAGVPRAGEIEVAGTKLVYDELVRDGSIFEFKIRGKLDPNITPLDAGSPLIARQRELTTLNGAYKIPAPGQLWLRDLPTRDAMWAPVAQEDQRHVQRLYGPLVSLDADVSSDAYLRRVQGAWYALMSGPAIENLRIGVHLTMGLPTAQVAGVVQRTYVRQNVLGEVVERGMVILGEDGAVTHRLDPTLQGINWAFEPGQSVDKFTPLTTGVQIYDVGVEDDWPSRFGMDPLSPERFNAFGVLVDMNTLNANTSLTDAVRFALRIKPTWSKMFFNLLLTAGNETIVVEDDMFFATVVEGCEDISFDEGSAPAPPQDLLRLGDSHKMGQGKRMGTSSVFRPFPALGVGLHMGTGLTMGMAPRAYTCAPNDDNLATEEVTVTAVVEVDVGS